MEKSKEFVITRVVNAPRELVWKAHTEESHLMNWWGPKGFKMIKVKMDLRPGGMFHYGMQGPDGSTMWGKFVYREVVPQEKLVFVLTFSDEQGGVTRHPMALDWPLEILNTITFTEKDGKTTVRISGYPINASPEEEAVYHSNHPSMQGGFTGTYNQLDEYLAGIKQD